MSDAATRIIAETLELGRRWALLVKDEDAWDLGPAEAKELLRAIELLASSMSGALEATYVTTRGPHGLVQRSFAAGEKTARSLRHVMQDAHRARGGA